MPNKISQIQHSEIIDLYTNQNVGCTTLAKKFGVSENAMIKRLRKAGVLRNKNEKLKDQQESIAKLYREGKSSPEIADILGCSSAGVAKAVKRAGGNIRNSSECHRKYEIDEHFFDQIDTQEKAYVLGFLYADGCNQPGANVVSINLSAKDIDIQIKIGKLIYKDFSDDRIKIRKRAQTKNGITKEFVHSYLILNSKYMCEKLESIGCGPRKSLTLKFPEWLVDKELVRHFIRGYYDGDGGLYFTYKKGRGALVRIISTIAFTKSIRMIIADELDILFGRETIKTKSGVEMCRIALCGNKQVYKFLDWLYKDSTIYLDRKYNLYKQFVTYYSNLKYRK